MFYELFKLSSVVMKQFQLYFILTLSLFYGTRGISFDNNQRFNLTNLRQDSNSETLFSLNYKIPVQHLSLRHLEVLPSIPTKVALDIYLRRETLCILTDETPQQVIRKIKGIGGKRAETLLKYLTLPSCKERYL